MGCGLCFLKRLEPWDPTWESLREEFFSAHQVDLWNKPDSITPISPAYKDIGSFPFTGRIDKVTFELTK